MMTDLKPCPFCGAVLEYEEHVAIFVQGQPTLQLWAHPAGGCILSGMEVPKEDHEAWNMRAGNAIEELFGETEQLPKWIPVTERLPSAEKEVYVTDGEYIARANLLDEVFPGDKPCWSYSGLGEITHWCEQIPLPKQPKEES